VQENLLDRSGATFGYSFWHHRSFLAPTPVPGDSVANIIEAMDLKEQHTLAKQRIALLTDAV